MFFIYYVMNRGRDRQVVSMMYFNLNHIGSVNFNTSLI